MDYDNYIELYEAIYFFDKINNQVLHNSPMAINQEQANTLGINESIYHAVMRILVVNNLLEYKNGLYYLTQEQKDNQRHILDTIININPSTHYPDLLKKSMNKTHFFFNHISEKEYEIYSRCNFPITFRIGQELIKKIDFDNMSILELGGNSGGLGSAILENNKKCDYTIVDTKIPCKVGNEYNHLNNQNIQFVVGDVFDLSLQTKTFNYITIMNLLHDFDDLKCLEILSNCQNYCQEDTKFLIVEDILNNEFEPKEVVMHGLRLAVECCGGKQRTQDEIADLFSNIHYHIEESIQLDRIHTMLVMARL